MGNAMARAKWPHTAHVYVRKYICTAVNDAELQFHCSGWCATTVPNKLPVPGLVLALRVEAAAPLVLAVGHAAHEVAVPAAVDAWGPPEHVWLFQI